MSTGEEPSTPAIEYYWRPGCPFCARLDRDLAAASLEVERHNIWEDPEAAAVVRSVANGNETVPTVRIGDTSLINPRISDVLDLVASSSG